MYKTELRIDLTPERQAQISSYLEKWRQILSTPIDRDKAIVTLANLYQRAGYPAPKIVFVDSPLSLIIACDELISQSEPFTGKRLGTNLQVTEKINSIYRLFDAQLLTLHINEGDRYYRSDLILAPFFGKPFDHKWTRQDEYFTHSDEVGEVSHTIDRSPLKGLLWQAGYASGVEFNRQRAYYHGCIRQIANVNKAAMYDCAAEFGVEFDSELLQLFLNTAMYLGWVILFDEICFVSDRPQVKFDSQGRLHAEGEPAFVFPDGFYRRYYYHGIELPEYIGSVYPHLWKAKWITQEQNAEIRRILLQEIGYARLCQELHAQILDSWREYTLLKLPIYDDVDLKEATYLLEMTCPSTNSIYALRVPPNLTSAKEAVTWINWGVDPEAFAVET